MNIVTPAVIGFLIVFIMCVVIFAMSLCKIAALSDERMDRMTEERNKEIENEG